MQNSFEQSLSPAETQEGGEISLERSIEVVSDLTTRTAQKPSPNDPPQMPKPRTKEETEALIEQLASRSPEWRRVVDELRHAQA